MKSSDFSDDPRMPEDLVGKLPKLWEILPFAWIIKVFIEKCKASMNLKKKNKECRPR